MSKFFELQNQHIRLSSIDAVTSVLPEFEEPTMQASIGGYGFRLTMRSGEKLEVIYRPGDYAFAPIVEMVNTLHTELLDALESDDG